MRACSSGARRELSFGDIPFQASIEPDAIQTIPDMKPFRKPLTWIAIML